jgi:carboxylate-amine ligase
VCTAKHALKKAPTDGLAPIIGGDHLVSWVLRGFGPPVQAGQFERGEVDHGRGVFGHRCPTLGIDAAGDDVHGIRQEPEVHGEVLLVGVPERDRLIGAEQRAQAFDRCGCLAVDVHPEQVRGREHQRVQARVRELVDEYGEGLVDSRGVVTLFGDALHDELEVSLAVGVATQPGAGLLAEQTLEPFDGGDVAVVREGVSVVDERVGVLRCQGQARRRPLKVHDAGPAEPLSAQSGVRRVADRRVVRGRTPDGVVVRVLPRHAPAVTVHGGECGERLKALLPEHLDDRGRAPGSHIEQTTHHAPILREGHRAHLRLDIETSLPAALRQLRCHTVGMRTVGVEEEFLLVDAHGNRTTPVATRVLRIATARGDADSEYAGTGSLNCELQEQQLEAYTSPHTAMSALEEELRGWRSKAASAAREAGACVVASATSPAQVEPQLVRNERYLEMAARFAIVAREQLTCGCHVHVSVGCAEEAVGVLDRIRVWLPVLVAVSANSPFWQGRDTGYASFRSQALLRWPVSGPTEIFGTPERYRGLVDGMLTSGTILDEGMVYFDARCSHRFPTVEIRAPDVCLDVRDAVLVAALGRGLVETAAEEWAAGEPTPPVPTSLLRLATWQAARWGISDRLLDPLTSRPRPASDVIAALVDHVRPVLRSSGDEAMVTERIERVFVRGNGATRQREVFERTGHLRDLNAALARATVGQDDWPLDQTDPELGKLTDDT